ncbi:C-Jun-amino-terminal kinase-interacting protein 4 [Trichinella zimbabwensis]|uniref:C-Jun-amino-terminal kinase-interacting protein 4 n=1 Tax=Trichinella zimbabwensis TaxID=268475 RepID=A0A0V1I094_9BILA|nr:C-Jun-amino-terminal kinase-interacting protein 4 [Trichinella zimbabwensis]
MTNLIKSDSGEMIFGTESSSSTEESRVMSEKVQTMASSIYKEFERMIQQFGEESVKDLMPLVVSMLEALDLAQLEKEEHEVELELLKEDNEQLVTQYEREKQLRRSTEQRCLEVEDVFEEERSGMKEKLESLESIVRMLELKAKNCTDQVARLEDREVESKQEYNKLHDRYTELFRTHMDYMERTKFLMGSDKFDVSMTSSGVFSSGTGKNFTVPQVHSHLVGQFHDDNVEGRDLNNYPRRSDRRSSAVDGWSFERTVPADAEFEAEDFCETPTKKAEEAESPPASTHNAADSGSDDALGVDLTGGLVDPAEFASAGMGREVENLIKENTELLETKNALNVVKNDLIAQLDGMASEQDILREEIRSLEMVRAKLNERLRELEQELKESKQSLEELRNRDENSDVPMAQRKRFTRIEMARVLMERNQYKEKLMELQEAVRWTEMIRASRNDPSLKRKRGSIWDFFNGLFSSGSNNAASDQHAMVNLRYNAPNRNLLPGSEKTRKSSNGKLKAFDFLDKNFSSERRAAERKEQYKLVKAHVKKDESGRFQAYGWSIPVLDAPQTSVPVPVSCQPLYENEPHLKIWCACGVDLNGGFTPDGGFIVGSSVFYSKEHLQDNFCQQPTQQAADEVGKLDYELKVKQMEIQRHQEREWLHSNLVWICSSARGRSLVSVIRANKANEIIDTFDVSSSHILCVCSISGADISDYLANSSSELDDCSTKPKESTTVNYDEQDVHSEATAAANSTTIWVDLIMDNQQRLLVRKNPLPATPAADNSNSGGLSEMQTGSAETAPEVQSSEVASEILISSMYGEEGVNSTTCTSTKKKQEVAKDEVLVAVSTADDDQEYKERIWKHLPEQVKDGLQKFSDHMSFATVLPTVWMGSQSGQLYIHSAVSEWRKCLHAVQLDDAILSIVHHKGRAFVALANGTVCVFCRKKNGEWNVDGYYLITIGMPSISVRCLAVVLDKIWCGYRNKIYIIDPKTLVVEHSFNAHPRKESQVRQLCWYGDGVWCSIRLDSSLRLFNAKTYRHIQDVDIEPYVSNMLGTSKLGFSFVRITSLLISCKRLWIGTGNGVVLSVPLTEQIEKKGILVQRCGKVVADSSSTTAAKSKPGEAIRVYSDGSGNSDQICPGTFVPYCNMVLAQLSFHGHRDAVKFFVAVPEVENSDRASRTADEAVDASKPATCDVKTMIVMSGGEGYIDFRVGDDDDLDTTQTGISRRDWSHLIVWEVKCET